MTTVHSPRTSPSASSAVEQLRELTALLALVGLGEVARQAGRSVAEDVERVPERVRQPARRFERDEGRLVAGDRLERRAARGGCSGQEAEESERVRRQARMRRAPW